MKVQMYQAGHTLDYNRVCGPSALGGEEGKILLNFFVTLREPGVAWRWWITSSSHTSCLGMAVVLLLKAARTFCVQEETDCPAPAIVHISNGHSQPGKSHRLFSSSGFCSVWGCSQTSFSGWHCKGCVPHVFLLLLNRWDENLSNQLERSSNQAH